MPEFFIREKLEIEDDLGIPHKTVGQRKKKHRVPALKWADSATGTSADLPDGWAVSFIPTCVRRVVMVSPSCKTTLPIELYLAQKEQR